MTSQLMIVGFLVSGAAFYIARAAWKSWFVKSAYGCGSGCGKCATPETDLQRPGRFPLPQA